MRAGRPARGEEEAQREGKPAECGDTGEQRRLLDTLRRRELDAIGEKLAEEFVRPFNKTAPGEYVTGAYRELARHFDRSSTAAANC